MFWLWNILISITIAMLVCAPRALHARGVDDIDAPPIESVSLRHWQRVFDPRHPEAPPRLVLKQTDNSRSVSQEKPQQVVCVRTGDRLVIHQRDGRASTLSLAARALESGACGAHIRARIAVTGVVSEVTVAEEGIGILGGRKDTWR